MNNEAKNTEEIFDLTVTSIAPPEPEPFSVLEEPKAFEALDTLNVDTIFLIRKIRATKDLDSFNVVKAEAINVREALENLSNRIKVTSGLKRLLKSRMAIRKIAYLSSWLSKEIYSREAYLNRKFKSYKNAPRKRTTITNARILAKLIIDAAIEENLKPKEYNSTDELTSAIANAEAAPDDSDSEAIATLISKSQPSADEATLNEDLFLNEFKEDL